MKTTEQSLVPSVRIERSIHLLRGQKVMLDADLAALYGVSTGNLNKAVSRNRNRFPPDFMFRLTPGEASAVLRFQTGISKAGRGGRRYLPNAFTEHGVAMLSSVLRSEKAVMVNIAIMRAFGRLRRFLADHAQLSRKLAALERRYDSRFRVVFAALRSLMAPEPAPRRPRIGFRSRSTRG